MGFFNKAPLWRILSPLPLPMAKRTMSLVPILNLLNAFHCLCLKIYLRRRYVLSSLLLSLIGNGDDLFFNWKFGLYCIFQQLKESQRRDGFEVGNADKIFESTSKDQLTRKVA